MVKATTLLAALTLSAGTAVWTTAAPVGGLLQAPTPAQPGQPDQPRPDQPSPAEFKIVTGTIESIDMENKTFKLNVLGEGDKEVQLDVRINDETRYLLDGEAAERDEVIVQGARVSVRHRNGLAEAVSHRTQPGEDPDQPARPDRPRPDRPGQPGQPGE